MLGILVSVLPSSPGSRHLLNAYCSEPLGISCWTNKTKRTPLSSWGLHSSGEADKRQCSHTQRVTQGEQGGAGDLGQLPEASSQKGPQTDVSQRSSELCWHLRQKEQRTQRPERGSRGRSTGAASHLWGLKGMRCRWRLLCLTWSSVSSRFLSFCFTGSTSSTLFLPLTVSSLQLKPFRFFFFSSKIAVFYIFQLSA